VIAQLPLNVGALHTFAAAVNQADVAEAGLVRRMQILLDHGPHVARCRRVQIDRILYGNAERLVLRVW
jgi:hypothetical protein